MTPDLFYGSYTRDEQGNLLRHPALRDCLSVFGTKTVLDINTAEPAVMGAVGVTPDAVTAIVNRRRQGVIKQADLGGLVSGAGPGAARLGIVPSVIVTLRATAALRLPSGQLSDLRAIRVRHGEDARPAVLTNRITSCAGTTTWWRRNEAA